MALPTAIYQVINGIHMTLESGVLTLAEKDGDLIRLDPNKISAVLLFMTYPHALDLLALSTDAHQEEIHQQRQLSYDQKPSTAHAVGEEMP